MSPVQVRHPNVDDGKAIWRIARDSQTLDVNSSYSYVLWCREFSSTSVITELDGATVGFVTGFVPPRDPSVLFVWQVAVETVARGRGIAGQMLDWLADRSPQTRQLQTNVTPSNTASLATFASFARRRGLTSTTEPWFDARHFPDGHESELLVRIGPW